MLREVKAFPSGNRLEVQPAPFAVASALRRAMAAELRAVALDGGDIDLSNLAGSGVPVNVLKDAVLSLLGSEKIENAIWDCMERGPAILNDQKMTRAMFDGPAGIPLRVDYLNCALEVALVNLSPFFANLDWSFLKPGPTATPAGPV